MEGLNISKPRFKNKKPLQLGHISSFMSYNLVKCVSHPDFVSPPPLSAVITLESVPSRPMKYCPRYIMSQHAAENGDKINEAPGCDDSVTSEKAPTHKRG